MIHYEDQALQYIDEHGLHGPLGRALENLLRVYPDVNVSIGFIDGGCVIETSEPVHWKFYDLLVRQDGRRILPVEFLFCSKEKI